MLPILNIGPLAIQTPGLVLLVGVWIGLSLSERYAAAFKVPAAQIYNLAFTALVAGLLGARLAYAARFPAAFAASPASLISLNPGLLDPLGGALVGALAAVIYGQRRGLALWPTLDALTPALAVLNVAAGLSHLAAGTAFGLPTDLPWGIELWGTSRHPTQLYLILSGLAILGFLWPGRAWLRGRPAGVLFSLFLALAGGSRLLVDGFRADGASLPNGLRVEQIAAWFVLALALALLGQRKDQRGSRENLPENK